MDLEELKQANPWWVSPQFRFDREGIIKRSIQDEVNRSIKPPQIISLLGLRRVGKTTILEGIGNDLLKRGIDAKRILYFSFEEHLGKKDPEIIDSILRLYFDQFLHANIWDISDRTYIFLDEIQYIENWQDVLKRYYDKNKRLKFIISGSFSAAIKKGGRESLAGRIFEIYIPPFSFKEFMTLDGFIEDITSIKTRDILDIDEDQCAQINKCSQLNKSHIDYKYKEFLYKGQFPECVTMNDPVLINKYIKISILKKILEEDAPKAFNVAKPGEFAEIFRILSRETGNLFELNNFAREVGISKDTLKNYLYYLDHLFLLKELSNYTKKLRKKYRIHKKVYATSPCFTCNELNLLPSSPLFEKMLGSLVETAIFHLLLSGNFTSYSFWRHVDKEIDFIIEESEVVPVEVKFKKEFKLADVKTALNFAEKNRLNTVVVITRFDCFIRKIGNIKLIAIPAWALH